MSFKFRTLILMLLTAVFFTPSIFIGHKEFQNGNQEADISHHADSNSVSHEHSHGSHTHEHNSEDCHCPMHHHGCHNSPIIQVEHFLNRFFSVEDLGFSSRYLFSFNSPFLEAPFQPPKA